VDVTAAAAVLHLPATLTVEEIETVEGLDRLEPEWRRLAQQAADGLPFRTYEWNRAWWAHLHAEDARVRDAMYVLAVRDAQGALIGVAPFMRTERPGTGPFRIRSLDFFGADPNVTEVRGPISAPGRDAAVLAACLDHLERRVDTWDFVLWRGVRVGSDAHGLLVARRGVHARDSNPNYVLPLTKTWEEFKSSRSRNIKESLRKCYNSLRRDGHAYTLDVATDEASAARALERFFVLHRARAEIEETVRHPNVFHAPKTRAFLEDACARLARSGMLRVFQLRIADAVVAIRIGFVVGDTLYLYFSGYDPAWGKYSVMTTAVAEAIRYAIGEGLSFVNLSIGTDVSKTRWSPRRVDLCDFVQVAPGLRAHLAYRAYHRVQELRASRFLRFLRRPSAQ
jgi:CelD/BcsL family acetyltransferase involved in cellulose biosynthesis